jgi:hypothetical protein
LDAVGKVTPARRDTSLSVRIGRCRTTKRLDAGGVVLEQHDEPLRRLHGVVGGLLHAFEEEIVR